MSGWNPFLRPTGARRGCSWGQCSPGWCRFPRQFSRPRSGEA